ncbi:MAG: polymer-forming cytoskeletal family protein [Nitrospirae bacterium]|nr:MAG: polymer-forming cytoskeletal family protein [Nitrospirota bacterium]
MLGKRVDKVETIIGSNTRMKGEVELKGALRVDGVFEGNLHADSVVIGEKGRVKGELRASAVVIGGTVEGNVYASEYVEIKSKGRMIGDVTTKKLTIIEGGIFEGRSNMTKEGPKVQQAPQPAEK